MKRIVEFTCVNGHHTPCDESIDNRYMKLNCGVCGILTDVWWNGRFAHVQTGAEAQVIATFRPNNLGVGDAVERKREMVLAAHAKAERQSIWGTNWWMARERGDYE